MPPRDTSMMIETSLAFMRVGKVEASRRVGEQVAQIDIRQVHSNLLLPPRVTCFQHADALLQRGQNTKMTSCIENKKLTRALRFTTNFKVGEARFTPPVAFFEIAMPSFHITYDNGFHRAKLIVSCDLFENSPDFVSDQSWHGCQSCNMKTLLGMISSQFHIPCSRTLKPELDLRMIKNLYLFGLMPSESIRK